MGVDYYKLGQNLGLDRDEYVRELALWQREVEDHIARSLGIPAKIAGEQEIERALRNVRRFRNLDERFPAGQELQPGQPVALNAAGQVVAATATVQEYELREAVLELPLLRMEAVLARLLPAGAAIVVYDLDGLIPENHEITAGTRVLCTPIPSRHGGWRLWGLVEEMQGFPTGFEAGPCPDCKGSGQYVGFAAIEPCTRCGGSGRA